MTTYVRTFAVTLLATFALTAAPERGTAATSDAPAGARLLTCRHAPTIDQRTTSVGTWMRPLPTGRRLALRIDLWQKAPGTRWTQRSDVPGLGAWTTPSDPLLGTRPGDVFKYRQAVGRLVVPAAYRFHVAFRWLGADGAVVREAGVTTAICRQPDLRPDLVISSVDVRPAVRSGLVKYSVLLGNEGKSPVAHVAVAATLPGDATPGLHLRPTGRIVPGGTVLVTFTGPGCAAGQPPATFVADPSNAVDEVDEANNGLAATCPAS
jgi:hypothetical protein